MVDQFTASVLVKTVPLAPTATIVVLSVATACKATAVPEEATAVQVVPSGEYEILPLLPTATHLLTLPAHYTTPRTVSVPCCPVRAVAVAQSSSLECTSPLAPTHTHVPEPSYAMAKMSCEPAKSTCKLQFPGTAGSAVVF